MNLTLRAAYAMKLPGEDRYGSVEVKEEAQIEWTHGEAIPEDLEAMFAAARARLQREVMRSVEERAKVVRDLHPAPAPLPPRTGGGGGGWRGPPRFAGPKPPSPGQLKFLEDLCRRAQIEFVAPATAEEVSKHIDRMKQRLGLATQPKAAP